MDITDHQIAEILARCTNQEHVHPAALAADARRIIVALHARVKRLESFLEKTADGELVCETEEFFCPNCGGVLRPEVDLAYCDQCANPDDGGSPNRPPLPMFYGMALSRRPTLNAQPSTR